MFMIYDVLILWLGLVLVTNGPTLAMTLAEDGCHSCSSRGSWNKHWLVTSQKLVDI